MAALCDPVLVSRSLSSRRKLGRALRPSPRAADRLIGAIRCRPASAVRIGSGFRLVGAVCGTRAASAAPARSAPPGRHRRRCRRAAAPCGRCRQASRRGPASARRRAHRQGRPRQRLRKPSNDRAASLAPTNMPSRANAAIGVSMPSTSRCSRSASGIVRPTGVGGRDQDAVAAIGKIKPRAAAGDEHAERRAEAAQPLQPDRAAWRQPARELRDLPPVHDRPDRMFFCQARRHWPRRTVWRRPDWPTESACRRSTTARPAARWLHAPPAADRRRLATGIPR